MDKQRPEDSSSDSIAGRTLSHYVLLSELRGGLYRARDEERNREVALKVLPAAAVQDSDRRRRFLAEANAAASLEHANIGVIHEVGESGGDLFIAMELPGGRSLADRLAAFPLSPREAVDLAIGIGSGLAYAHERGVVHREIQPANVALTEEGRPKLVGFGLAKLLEAERSPFLGHAGEDESALQRREGGSPGAVAFMSPEQARGGRVDERSDVFSFGLLLYTMVTGRPPFEGTSRIETLHAILREPTPRLFGLPAEARQLLQPIVDRCLRKEPHLRPQSLSPVLEDLKRARRELESGGLLGRGARRALLAGAALVLATAVLYLLSSESSRPPVIAETPSLAVLHFENLSGDPELDWLRTGLADMLVTELSQSPELEVQGLDRLHPLLEELERREGSPLTKDAVDALARRAGVHSVLTGSFARAGDSIRVSARLEDTATGDLLLSENEEARGEESVFRLVDDISARIRSTLGIPAPEGELDRDLREVTTASIEAYREYAEGIRLHERFREGEAVPHFQRAIELDPGFAMALAKLGVVMSNLGLHEEADQYAERALGHVDRLSERERLYIEGWYYSRRPKTLSRAFAAYREAIELYPDHGSARHNLGNLLFETERYREAIVQLEELRRRRMSFPATYEQLAMAYKGLGDVDRARQVLEEYAERHPDDWTTVLSLAALEIDTGDVEDGLAYLDRAEALGATPFRTAPVMWGAQVLREEWEEAKDTAEALMESEGPVEKFLGGRLWTTTALYRGEVEPALDAIHRFVAQVEGNRTYRARPLLLEARILLETGKNEQAKETALAVASEDDRYGISSQALLVAAIAAARLGERSEADRLSREYRRRIDPALGPAPERLYHFLQGELAMARGQLPRAIAELKEAESMLPPRGGDGGHALIWYSLATAHRLSGNDGEAIDWYERIVSSTEERLFEPIGYVRSFYFLGALREAEGEHERARRVYERFLHHWEGGELDRDLVAEARAALR